MVQELFDEKLKKKKINGDNYEENEGGREL